MCLSSDSGPWRLAPSGRDQDPESERPLRHNAEARVKKRQRAHQPRAEGNQTVCVCVCVLLKLETKREREFIHEWMFLFEVGICGRTGSGKSSFSLAFFRMVDMFEGKTSTLQIK